MRALRVAGAALGALFCAACTVPDATPDGTPSTPSLVVTSVDIVDVESGEILQDRTISIGGERILEVTGEPPPGLPDGVRVIDGRGLYAIPGLWDMHMHNVADTADLVPWDFHRPDPGDPDAREIYLPIYLAFGVTGTREMSGGEGSLALRDRIERGEILGPHMVVGSPILDGDPPLLAGGSQILIPGPARARAVVDSLYEAGFDFLKPYTLLTAETYRALVARADELEIEVAGELPLAISAWEAAHLGQRSIEHLTGIELASSGREAELREGYLAGLRALDPDSGGTGALEIWNRGEWEPLETLDPEKQGRLFAHLAARDTWVVPTLVVQRMISYGDDPEIAGDPNFRYVDPWSRDLKAVADEYDPQRRLRAAYDHRAALIADLHAAGVGILAGSDQVGGFTLHDELELFVEGGLTPLDALRTATLAPARFLGREEDLGSIAPGKIADLVLLGADPLDDIGNTRSIEMVIFRGHPLDRAHLDRMLEQLAVDAADWPEG